MTFSYIQLQREEVWCSVWRSGTDAADLSWFNFIHRGNVSKNPDRTDYLVTFMSNIIGHKERAPSTTTGIPAALTHKIFLVRSSRSDWCGQYWCPIILKICVHACSKIFPEKGTNFFPDSTCTHYIVVTILLRKLWHSC